MAGFEESDVLVNRSVDMRYRYQVHELNVPFSSGNNGDTAKEMEALYTLFDDLYEKRSAKAQVSRGRERILTFRLTATGLLKSRISRPNEYKGPMERTLSRGSAMSTSRKSGKFVVNASL